MQRFATMSQTGLPLDPKTNDATSSSAFPWTDADVVIVGAGPVGLTLANFLGMQGVRTVLLDQLDRLIDYPRGVGIDDEALRVFQVLGLVDGVRRHTVPDHPLHFVTRSGRTLFTVHPGTREYGWPRRNGFIQPLVDREVHEGLSRFACVQSVFGWTLESLEEAGDGVNLDVLRSDGTRATLHAKYVVGCDGGRSLVRKTMGVAFDGITESTKWLVVDLADDPIGTPSVFAICHPETPYISIGLPNGVRRFEFMVPEDQTEESLRASGAIDRLVAGALGGKTPANMIRARVYTHHARVASAFRKGRMIIAGDAAHLMPVWQGQGYNTGIRDAANLGWKLPRVIDGRAGEALLDTYDEERRRHVKAMVDISVTAGRIIMPPTRLHGWAQGAFFWVTQNIGWLRRFIMEMRFKPMPLYDRGAVVRVLGAGRSPVGRMFIQPWVSLEAGGKVRFDDAAGSGFALLSWGSHPTRHLDEAAKLVLRALGAVNLVIRPECQRGGEPVNPAVQVVYDSDGELHRWFDAFDTAVLLLRPDRFVAMSCRAMDVSSHIAQFAASMHLNVTATKRMHTEVGT